MTTGSPKELKQGDVVDGRFVVRRLLGRGNFSAVYRATQMIHDVHLRDVALKVFNERVGPDNIREVMNDAIVLFRLDEYHPPMEVDRHLVHILDGNAGSGPTDQAYLVMELVAGGELTKAITRYSGLPDVGGIPLELSLFYLQQILVPLAWMHSQDPPAVHGDLHPGNVLVTDKGDVKGDVKVADFGLAARLPAPVFGGAIAYQAPETLLGQPGNTRVDVYGLGLVWYEMLTGKSPFRSDELRALGDDLSLLSIEVKALGDAGDPRDLEEKKARKEEKRREYVRAHVEARKRPLERASEINRQLQDHLPLEEILERCLAYAPHERYFTAAAVRKDIDDYLAQTGDALVVDTGPIDPEPAKEKVKLPEETPEKHLKDARILAGRGEFCRAHEAADKALGMRPRSVEAWLVKFRITLAEAKAAQTDAERKERLNGAWKCLACPEKIESKSSRVLEAKADFYEASGKSAMAENLRRQAGNL